MLQKYEQLNMDAEGIVSVIIESNDCQRLVREGQFVSTGTREMFVCVRELALVTETYTDTDTDTDIDIDIDTDTDTDTDTDRHRHRHRHR